MNTNLLYMEHMSQYSCDATVTGIETQDDKTVVILDQTVFYPQGGGQPYDTGVIKSDNADFRVTEVRFVDGAVRHIGNFIGDPFTVGSTVTCLVDIDRRKLHARLHSAGHVLDMGLKRLDILWTPRKGYHFPDGPYVEYSGSLVDVDTEKLKAELEAACNQIIQEGIDTRVIFMPKEEVHAGKPTRVVMYGDFGIPCGGTHVANLHDIQKITIRKIKNKSGNILVAYAL